MARTATAEAGHTDALARFIHDFPGRELPEEVVEKTKMHVLDTLAAIATGMHLDAGIAGRRYVDGRSGTSEASIVGVPQKANAELAALANGLAAHADETDDSHEPSRMHPGCAIVPSALASAELAGRSGLDMVKAVCLGYGVGASVNRAIFAPGTVLRQALNSTHMMGSLFGSYGAASSLAGLDPTELRHGLSYVAQQASGFTAWNRDTQHIEKSFDFAGLPAHNAVRTVGLIQAGFTGVDDIFDESPNVFDLFGHDPTPERMMQELEEGYHVMQANIKKFPIGSPIQAPAQALTDLMEEEPIDPADVVSITCHLPAEIAGVVDARTMANISLQFVLAVALVDGRVTFRNTHDYDRPNDPVVADLMQRITLVHDQEMEPTRQGTVIVELASGRTRRCHVFPVRGTKDNPMEWPEVTGKARSLLEEVMDPAAAGELVDTVVALDTAADVDHLATQLRAVPA